MAVRPMLAISIPKGDLTTYLESHEWMTQIKADGHRFLIEVIDGNVSVYNRDGQPKVSNIPPAVLQMFRDFTHGRWVFDGELIVGGVLALFDLITAGRVVGPHTPFEERHFTLSTLMDEWKPDPAKVFLLPCAETTDEKVAMFRDAMTNQREGVIVRRRSGLYKAGRSTDLLRYKFEKDIDCIVTDLGVGGHDNVQLTLLDPERKHSASGRVNVGEASALFKKPKPQKGDVWSVRFLGVYDRSKPRLVQPRLLARRSTFVLNELTGEAESVGEKAMEECLFSQLDDAWLDRDITLKTRGNL